MARGQGTDFVLAVGVEGGKVEVERIGGVGEINGLLLPLVAHHQFAALVRRRQDDDQSGNHAFQFLAVAMGQKEAAWLVEEQVVEVGFQLLFLQAEFLLDLAYRLLQENVPVGIGQREAVRLQFPDAANAGIDDGLLTLAIGGLPAQLFQRLGLRRSERQGDRTESLDFQARQHGRGTAADAKGSWPVDLVQHLAQFARDGGADGFALRNGLAVRFALAASRGSPGGTCESPEIDRLPRVSHNRSHRFIRQRQTAHPVIITPSGKIRTSNVVASLREAS